MTSLYKLTGILQSIYDKIEEEEGEVSESLEALLDKVEGEHEQKLERTGYLYKSVVAEVAALRDEIQALTKRKKIAENKAERIKQYLHQNLRGTKKAGVIQFVLRKSKAVEVEDFDALPNEFKKLKIEADKTAIGRDLKAGISVPGAILIEKENLTVM